VTREEVIRGLKGLAGWLDGKYEQTGEVDYDTDAEIVEEAIALLKEQEPVAPELKSGGNYVCGACGMYTVGVMHPLTGVSVQTWKYCGKCGKKVRWE